MTRNEKAGRRRLTVAAVAAIAVALLASLAIAARPGAAARGGEAGSCQHAAEPSVGIRLAQVRKSIRCLINESRAARGAQPVAGSKNLQKAAQRHTRKMVKTGCLAHRCGDEPTLAQRVRDSGYLAGASSWRYAENTGCGLSAEAMVANWLAVQFHRANILEKKFRDIGIGVVQRRTPGHCSTGFSTFTLVFGFRTN